MLLKGAVSKSLSKFNLQLLASLLGQGFSRVSTVSGLFLKLSSLVDKLGSF